MSAATTFAWAGLGLIGIAVLAPSLRRADAPAPPPAVLSEPAAPSAPATSGGPRNYSRSADGHFYVEAQVNGTRVRFIVDTGASVVALTLADARRAGIALPDERATATGAGGEVEIRPVVIDRIALGTLEARGVRGAIAEQLPVSLLGQSFLAQAGSVEIRGDVMVVR